MIIRIQKRADPFARMPKAILNDNRLSWRAKGILCYLLGKPNDWIVQRGDILNHATEGQKAVRAAFRELAQHGYAVLKNTNAGREWHVSDTPQAAEKATCACDPKGNLPKSTTTKNEGSTKNDPPIVPQGGRNGKAEKENQTAEYADRIAAIYHRKPNTPWSAKEIKAFKTLLPFNDDNLCMVERRYAAEWPPREGNTLRRDLLTFLNNYRGEEDRGLSWAEKHPVRSKTLKAPISLHSEAPPPDPAAQAKFLEDFQAKFGRLPYGHNPNGDEYTTV